MVIVFWILLLGALAAAITRWFLRQRADWALSLLLSVVGLLGIAGLLLIHSDFRPAYTDVTIAYVFGAVLFTTALAAAFFGFIEFALLRILGLFRLGAIARVTYYEALLQPFTLIVITVGIITIGIAARYPYFTYDQDFKMYRDVASSFLLLFTLPIMIFASTKVIDEEIENRTMLTLMSKPVARWQVVLGKYFGVLLLVLAVLITLALFAGVFGYLRFFDDSMIDFRLAGPPTSPTYLGLIHDNDKALLALIPSVILQFLQLASLAAISVAISTRYGLAVNITAIVVVYMAANLARYGTSATIPEPYNAIIQVISNLLPGLGLLDLNPRLIFGNYLLGAEWTRNTPTYSAIWQYVGLSFLYALFYVAAALSFGIALFRTRELS